MSVQKKKEYNPVFDLCKQCGEVFEKYRPYHKYCNIECRNIMYKRKYTYIKKKIKNRKCKMCGDAFKTNDAKRKYCSTKCYLDYQEKYYKPVDAIKRICPVCKEPFETTHHAKIYCSPECYKLKRDLRNANRSLKK